MVPVPEILGAISSAASSPTLTGFPAQNTQSLYFFLVFIAIIIAVRLYRGISGRVYTTVRVVRLPVTYLILTVLTILVFGFIDSSLILALLLVPVGFILGYKLGVNVQFFMKNGLLYYKRSSAMLITWLASFMGRFILEYLFPNSFTVILVVDVALALTTGLLMGEAVNIVKKRRAYVMPTHPENEELDSFRINM